MKNEAEPEFASKMQTELKTLNTQWDHICQQVLLPAESGSLLINFFLKMHNFPHLKHNYWMLEVELGIKGKH